MKPSIDKSSKVPAYRQIANAFKEQILNGSLLPGDPLPPARELANELNLSTPTITRAYSQLDDAGLTLTHHGKGTFVCLPENMSSHKNTNTSISNNLVFISYSHSDEEASCGAISKFRDALAKEYKLQTGENLNTFFDKNSIEWGSNWRDTIQQNIGATIIFMPFLSPSFLNSSSCINELRSAQLAFDERKLKQGICPLMFVDCIERLQGLTDDALANMLCNDQWRDITELQYEDPSSSSYRKAVREIVKEIRSISQNINNTLFLPKQETDYTITETESEGGFLEAIADMESNTFAAKERIEQFGDIIETIGKITGPYSEKIENAKTFKERISTLRQYSNDLMPYAEKSKVIVTEINSYVQDIDLNVGIILDCIPYIITLSDEGNKQNIIDFCNVLSALQENAEIGFDEAENFRNQIGPLSKLSRELKNPLNTLRDALDLYLSNRDIFLQWKKESDRILKELEDSQ